MFLVPKPIGRIIALIAGIQIEFRDLIRNGSGCFMATNETNIKTNWDIAFRDGNEGLECSPTNKRFSKSVMYFLCFVAIYGSAPAAADCGKNTRRFGNGKLSNGAAPITKAPTEKRTRGERYIPTEPTYEHQNDSQPVQREVDQRAIDRGEEMVFGSSVGTVRTARILIEDRRVSVAVRKSNSHGFLTVGTERFVYDRVADEGDGNLVFVPEKRANRQSDKGPNKRVIVITKGTPQFENVVSREQSKSGLRVYETTDAIFEFVNVDKLGRDYNHTYASVRFGP